MPKTGEKEGEEASHRRLAGATYLAKLKRRGAKAKGDFTPFNDGFGSMKFSVGELLF